ncbi:hypothetical protein BDC45DRAFT_499144 [Circinella umbellata]|nr:hypothetical protein BDC45DRAFT_499144 [Circinella umbellata]
MNQDAILLTSFPLKLRIFMQHIFPQISYELARNPPFSTFMLNKCQVMRQQVLNEVCSARIHNKPISFSFPFLFMMYYTADIEIDDESLKYYHGYFYCSSRSIPDVILICGSNCLNTLHIHQELPRKTVKRTLHNLHNINFQGTDQKKEKLAQFIKVNFLAIRQIQIT